MGLKIRFQPASSFTIAGLVFLVTVSAVQPASAAAPWRSDYQQAQTEALRDGKLLLLHFHASWCGPCRVMERNVLSSPSLVKYLGSDVIAVKIDSDRYPDLTRKLNVQSLPSDIFITPQGKVVHRYSGSQAAGSYFQMVSNVSTKFSRARKATIAKQEAHAKKAETPVVRKEDPPQEMMARVDQPFTADSTDRTDEQPEEKSTSDVSLDGFCPVTLWSQREWKRGEGEYVANYQGLTYVMAGPKELSRFREDPRRFAPRLLGCDPVVLSETDRAVPGSTTYGAFYDGELYLFQSNETRSRFKENPLQYSRTHHVLRDELQRRRR